VPRWQTRGVGIRAGVAHRSLVGRAGETEAVVGLVQAAASGEAGALLVSGEAGVGKTALVREACAWVGEVAEVVWGSCLPLTSLAVPFLPLASALRTWAAGREVPVPVLGGGGGAGPGGGGGGGAGPGRVRRLAGRDVPAASGGVGGR
jgi:hypothetical protein